MALVSWDISTAIRNISEEFQILGVAGGTAHEELLLDEEFEVVGSLKTLEGPLNSWFLAVAKLTWKENAYTAFPRYDCYTSGGAKLERMISGAYVPGSYKAGNRIITSRHSLSISMSFTRLNRRYPYSNIRSFY